MLACSSFATVRASRTKRSASTGDGVWPRSSTLTATSRRSALSRTRNTAAKPPSPSRAPTLNSSPRASWRRARSVERSSDMADAKPRKTRQVALGTTALVALVWLLGVWPPPVWWRTHWPRQTARSEEHTSELQSRENLVCRLLLEKKKKKQNTTKSKKKKTKTTKGQTR